MVNTTIRVLLVSGLLTTFPGLSFSYDDIRQAFYQPPQTNFLPQFNRQFEPRFQPSSFNKLSLSMMPDLNLSVFSARVPKFEVRDLGGSFWSYNQPSFSFNENRQLASFSSNIQTPQASYISLEMSKFKYEEKGDSPTGFRTTYRDQKGTTFWKERTKQSSIINTSYNNYVGAADKWERVRKFWDVGPNLNMTRYPPPTKELVGSFQERWRISSPDPQFAKGPLDYQLSVHSMEYDANRWLSSYKGTLDRGHSTLSFDVRAPRNDHGDIKYLQVTISGVGAPTVEVRWNPSQSQDQNEAFGLLRESLPIPLLAGPRSAFRLNEVDTPESPLKLTSQGNISANQVGKDQDISRLFGKENLGISVTVSAPGEDSKTKGFSIVNSLRNLWYMVTGKWSDVKTMRQGLTDLRDNDPKKFVLAAGFRDPSFMSLSDLKGYRQKIETPQFQSFVRGLDQEPAARQFKSFQDPSGKSFSFENPMVLTRSDDVYRLKEPVSLPSDFLPTEKGIKGQPELTKAKFTLQNDTLKMQEGVIKVGPEKFFMDQHGRLTDVNVIAQALDKVENLANHLQDRGHRLESALSISMDVSNKLLHNLHGITGQFLTSEFQQTEAMSEYVEAIGSLGEHSKELQGSFKAEDYGAVIKATPELEKTGKDIKSREGEFRNQIQTLGRFTESLMDLTKKLPELLSNINYDHMMTDEVNPQTIDANSSFFFSDEKTLLSRDANEVLDRMGDLGEKGLVDKEVLREWAGGIINARDRLMVAVPRMGYEIDRTMDFLRRPLTESRSALNRKADVLFFDRWDRMIDTDPERVTAIATKGLFVAKAVRIVNIAVGLYGTGAWAIQAPVKLGLTLLGGFGAEKALSAAGVNDEAAKVYGRAIGLAFGMKAPKLAKSPIMNRAMNFAKTGWNKMGALMENMSMGFPRMSRPLGRLMNSERGSILLFGKSRNQSPPIVKVRGNVIWDPIKRQFLDPISKKFVPGQRFDYSHEIRSELKYFDGNIKKFSGILSEDKYVVQFHGNHPLGKGRSAKYWTTIEEANDFKTLDQVVDRMALLPEWGTRDFVSVARIPKGAQIVFYEGNAKLQTSLSGKEFHGGGRQILFEEFDPRWIIQSRQIPR